MNCNNCTCNDDEKLKELKKIMEKYKNGERSESHLITILHKAQEFYGYLSNETMDNIAEFMNIPTSHIWGVATFYHHFNLKPKGEHIISVCLGTACYVKGAEKIIEALKEELKVDLGGTTEDKLFTLNETRCLGACALAPVMMVDNKVYGRLTPKLATEIIREIKKK